MPAVPAVPVVACGCGVVVCVLDPNRSCRARIRRPATTTTTTTNHDTTTIELASRHHRHHRHLRPPLPRPARCRYTSSPPSSCPRPQMNERGIKPNVISYGAAISACCAKGRWERAIELLREMSDAGVPPNTITFSAAISACEKAGRWEKALQLLDEVSGWLLAWQLLSLRPLPHGVLFPARDTRTTSHITHHGTDG